MTTDSKPFGYFHELLNHEGKGTGVWLGCPDRTSTEKAHIEGATGKEIVALYAAPQPAQPSLGQIADALPDNLYDSKDWRDSDILGRVEWLKAMYAAKKAELDAQPAPVPAEQSDLTFSHTNRGFALVEFSDRNDVKCSLQESSIATEAAIWLGCNEASPQVLVPGSGWQPVDMPADYIANTRMHLTQDKVRELLPILQHFVETGEVTTQPAQQPEQEG